MDCGEYRRELDRDPLAETPEMADHVRRCRGCHQCRETRRMMEARLMQAMELRPDHRLDERVRAIPGADSRASGRGCRAVTITALLSSVLCLVRRIAGRF